MQRAPSLQELVDLTFNGVAFAANMAMFDFGPLRPRLLKFGKRKGETIMTGSHALHIQCGWHLRRRHAVLATSALTRPAALQPLVDLTVDSVQVSETGNLMLALSEFRIEVVAYNDPDQEDWRLLTVDPDQDHLVWRESDDAR